VSVLRPLAAGLICASGALTAAHADDPQPAAVPTGAATPAPSDDRSPVPADTGQSAISNRTVVNRETFERDSSQTSVETIKNVPGVINSDTKGGNSDDIMIRGIHLSETTSYRLNGGFPIVNNIPLLEDKERVEALKGVSALMFGLAPPSGVVNFVTKRATVDPITTLQLSGTSFGQVIEHMDFGRKFGSDNQFGVRTNLSFGHVEKGVDGANGSRMVGTVAGDWRVTDRLKFWFDFEGYDLDVVEQTVIRQLKAVNGVVPLPTMPDPTKLLSGPWATYHTNGTNILVGGDYDIGGGWDFVAEAGRSEARRLDRHLSQISGYNLITGQGTETITLVHDQDYINTNVKAELRNKTDFGPFANDLTLGINRNERYFNFPSTTAVKVSQNLYNPVALPDPGPGAPLTFTPQDSRDLGLYAYDTVHLFDRLHVLGGIRHTNYTGDDTKNDGTHTTTTSNVLSPAVGAIFDLTPKIAVYANYMKGLEETGAAPLGAANQFQILPPASATEYEMGIRATNIYGVSATFARFGITRANAITNPTTNIFEIDGTTQFQGYESTVSIDLGRQWNVAAGGQLMNAVQHAAGNPSINGLQPENTPKVAGNLTLTYRPDWFKGLRLNAGASFIGARPVNPQDQGTIPTVTLYSVGAGYTTTIDGHRTIFNLSVTNLMNERYWSNAVNGNLGVGTPRTFRISAKVEF
jgi:iron complex outermembrane receptor protein